MDENASRMAKAELEKVDRASQPAAGRHHCHWCYDAPSERRRCR
jgi:hypothetical protein